MANASWGAAAAAAASQRRSARGRRGAQQHRCLRRLQPRRPTRHMLLLPSAAAWLSSMAAGAVASTSRAPIESSLRPESALRRCSSCCCLCCTAAHCCAMLLRVCCCGLAALLPLLLRSCRHAAKCRSARPRSSSLLAASATGVRHCIAAALPSYSCATAHAHAPPATRQPCGAARRSAHARCPAAHPQWPPWGCGSPGRCSCTTAGRPCRQSSWRSCCSCGARQGPRRARAVRRRRRRRRRRRCRRRLPAGRRAAHRGRCGMRRLLDAPERRQEPPASRHARAAPLAGPPGLPRAPLHRQAAPRTRAARTAAAGTPSRSATGGREHGGAACEAPGRPIALALGSGALGQAAGPPQGPDPPNSAAAPLARLVSHGDCSTATEGYHASLGREGEAGRPPQFHRASLPCAAGRRCLHSSTLRQSALLAALVHAVQLSRARAGRPGSLHSPSQSPAPLTGACSASHCPCSHERHPRHSSLALQAP